MHFIRGMIYPNPNSPGSIGRGMTWRMKWIYEFWGFCVNGTASTTTPGGFASNNGVVFPTDFTGGTSLMAHGTDGYHPVASGDLFSGDLVFTSMSATFTNAMVGKALVMWKPNSNSSEDSIYLITRVINSNQLLININTGGTPNPSTKHPSMTARSGVNYRVVDMVAGHEAATVTSALGSFMVLELDAASVNPGQGNAQGKSQIQFVSNSRGSGSDFGTNFWIGFGGSGQWIGSPLSITSATNTNPIVITTASPHGYVTGQTVTVVGGGGNLQMNVIRMITVTGPTTFTLDGVAGNGTYTGGGIVYSGFPNDGYQGVTGYTMSSGAAYTGGQTCINMIADKTFMIAHIREQDLFQSNSRLCIHVEVPKRLYPEGVDQHPLAILGETANTGSLYTSSSTLSYGGGWLMRSHPSDPQTFQSAGTRNFRTLTKSMFGDGTFPNSVGTAGTLFNQGIFGQSISDYRLGYNTVAGTVPMADGLLSVTGVSNQFSFARVRLRTVKFTGTHVPSHHRLGLNGEFIQLQNGICWPWDNTIIPHQILLFGSG